MTENSVLAKTHYLAGGFQYKNNVLQFFSQAEGYVKKEANNYSYVFNYTDHLGNIRLSYTDTDNNGTIDIDEIVEENHYYPFGLKHESHISSNAYQMKYNGKELQTELGLNLYDYGFRNYDPAIGRWMNMDNLAEKFIIHSPYHYAGNNPVLNLDIDGNEFTTSAWRWVNRLLDEYYRKKEHNAKNLDDLNAKIAAGGSDRQIANWNRQKERLAEKNVVLDVVMSEIDILSASDQVYDVVQNNRGTSSDVSGSTTTTNQTTFNSSNGYVQISVSSGTSVGLFAHELKHAYDFEAGNFSLGLTKNNGQTNIFGGTLLFYDLNDEFDGYKRGDLFGTNEYLFSPLDVIRRKGYDSRIPTGPYSSINHPIISRIKQNPQSAANVFNAAFRINGKTYVPNPNQ